MASYSATAGHGLARYLPAAPFVAPVTTKTRRKVCSPNFAHAIPVLVKAKIYLMTALWPENSARLPRRGFSGKEANKAKQQRNHCEQPGEEPYILGQHAQPRGAEANHAGTGDNEDQHHGQHRSQR